jgi:hypothetical protein
VTQEGLLMRFHISNWHNGKRQQVNPGVLACMAIVIPETYKQEEVISLPQMAVARQLFSFFAVAFVIGLSTDSGFLVPEKIQSPKLSVYLSLISNY